jgi:hypothetical protein
MDERREVKFQEALLRLKLRLMKGPRLHRNQMRYSCMWATDAEFQQILDAAVADGIAVREIGAGGGEWYRSVANA